MRNVWQVVSRTQHYINAINHLIWKTLSFYFIVSLVQYVLKVYYYTYMKNRKSIVLLCIEVSSQRKLEGLFIAFYQKKRHLCIIYLLCYYSTIKNRLSSSPLLRFLVSSRENTIIKRNWITFSSTETKAW